MKQTDLNVRLCLAVVATDPQEVEALLAAGADSNSVGDKRYTRIAHSTPLWLSVSNAVQEASKAWADLYTAVREISADLKERDHAGERQKLAEIAGMLIRAGADLEKRSFGSTPLRIAVSHRDLEMVSMLLANGADPNAETYSPISKLAKEERQKGRLGLMGYLNTPLHEAVEKDALCVAKALLAAGADPARTDQ